MPSPFPGMDPYLEGEMWQEFHATLANAIRGQILSALPAAYTALLAKRYERLLDYAAPPPPPALASDEQAWVAARLCQADVRPPSAGEV